MCRAAAIAFAFMTLLSLGVACGGDYGSGTPTEKATVTVTATATATMTSTPSPTSSQTGTPQGGDVGVTTAHRSTAYPGYSIDATLDETDRLPADSDWHGELYGVWLTILNTGKKYYEASAVAECCVLVDEQNVGHDGIAWVQSSDGEELPDQLNEVDIAPGDERSGWVYFELPFDRDARLLQFKAFNYSDSHGVGEWSLE
jgi:hypothetical protein